MLDGTKPISCACTFPLQKLQGLATFNLLVQWHGLKPDPQGMIRLSLAEFSL